MSIAQKITESELLAHVADEVEMLNKELLAEFALRTVRNVIAFRGEA